MDNGLRNEISKIILDLIPLPFIQDLYNDDIKIFKDLARKCVCSKTYHLYLQTYCLDSGKLRFDYSKILEMQNSIFNKNDFWILLCGYACYNDLGLSIINNNYNIDVVLAGHNIKRLLCIDININEAYLFGLNGFKNIKKDNIVKFVRD